MFKRILIPTDGSALSARAEKRGIALAKESGARVIGYHALVPMATHLYGEGWVADRTVLQEFERRRREGAMKHVAALARRAREARVPFEPVVEAARTPYEGIVETAHQRRCDLIFMASHGHRGLTRLALGSVAGKVITLSKVPVLVYR